MASVLQWPVFSGAHTGGIKFLLQSRLSYADAGCLQNVCSGELSGRGWTRSGH